VIQVVEHLPSKYKALCSNHSIIKEFKTFCFKKHHQETEKATENGRMFLQTVYFLKMQYPEYMKHFHNSTTTTTTTTKGQ
jgi:hypothetical protein